MKAARHNLTIWKGETFVTVFVYYNGPSLSNATKDLTGWTAELLARPARGEVFVLASSDDGTITLSADGGVEIVVEAEVSEDYDWKVANYLLLLTDPGTAEVTPLAWGFIQARGVQ